MTTTMGHKDLDAPLAALRGDYTVLESRLRRVTHSVSCPLTGVQLRLHHPAFRDGKATVYDLAIAISHFLTHFALPRSDCDRVTKLYGKVPASKYDLEFSILKQKARDTFKKAHEATNRNGEAGELLLFLLTEWQLGAPQILAKLGLKTNPIMAVHGADGVHVRYDDNQKRLIFYFGESKVYGSLSDALSAAASSISNALQPRQTKYELDLVARYIPVSGLSEDAQEALLSYLHPFGDNSNAYETVITCLVCYNSNKYDGLVVEGNLEREQEFEGKSSADLPTMAKQIAKVLGASGLTRQKVELFLLPMPSVADFREYFQDEIGWKK